MFANYQVGLAEVSEGTGLGSLDLPFRQPFGLYRGPNGVGGTRATPDQLQDSQVRMASQVTEFVCHPKSSPSLLVLSPCGARHCVCATLS